MRKQEAFFQVGVVRLLRMTGFYVFAVPNGGSRHVREAHNLKLQGVTAGVSDLVVLLPKGRAVFVELKSPDGSGRQSPAQRDFEDTVKALGFEYLLWQNWADVEAFIKAHRHRVEDSVKIGGTI